ncbi:MAG: NifB/NifX family molybdenum-iron cluster-binding protein [Eubacteriales bacterium]|nr:NifB/NifX family molybdenum-iron cluster-binding protein [Eubacteriales bacterium]
MDEKKRLIAVASSDGIVVNQHFGRAKSFLIYKIENDIPSLWEKREVKPVCEGGNHDEEKLLKNIERISDCHYLLVSRIGNGAAALAERKGIECYEIPGLIEDSINQMINYEKLKQLFM